MQIPPSLQTVIHPRRDLSFHPNAQLFPPGTQSPNTIDPFPFRISLNPSATPLSTTTFLNLYIYF